MFAYIFILIYSFISIAVPIDQYFCGSPETYARMDLLETLYCPSSFQCSLRCKAIERCIGVNYNTGTDTCQLISTGNYITTPHDITYDVYFKC